MQSRTFKHSSLGARMAVTVFGLVCSFSSLAAVLALFASASGELDPILAKFNAARSASEVAVKAPAKPLRG